MSDRTTKVINVMIGTRMILTKITREDNENARNSKSNDEKLL